MRDDPNPNLPTAHVPLIAQREPGPLAKPRKFRLLPEFAKPKPPAPGTCSGRRGRHNKGTLCVSLSTLQILPGASHSNESEQASLLASSFYKTVVPEAIRGVCRRGRDG